VFNDSFGAALTRSSPVHRLRRHQKSTRWPQPSRGIGRTTYALATRSRWS